MQFLVACSHELVSHSLDELLRFAAGQGTIIEVLEQVQMIRDFLWIA